MKIFLALKSVEIVALPTSEAGVPERKIVRVLFSDGSVKYYDDGVLDGSGELENAPSKGYEYMARDMGEWRELERGLPPTKEDERPVESLNAVDKAKAQIATSRKLAVLWLRRSEDLLALRNVEKSVLPPLEALASFFIETKEAFDFVNAEVKSVKIVPTPANVEGEPERSPFASCLAMEALSTLTTGS